MKSFILFITFSCLLYSYRGKVVEALLKEKTVDQGTLSESQTSGLENPLESQIDNLLNVLKNQIDNYGEPAEILIDQLSKLFDKLSEQLATPFASKIEDPDAYRNVSELITSRGYPLEEHTVQTTDGYLLSMQRIPYGKNNNTQRGDKEVVLLVHGELGDGKTWFLNPPGQGLGYILPDRGYDVWVINCRGSTYSQKNIYFPTRSFQFWDFSLDEIAKYDLTATIDYVLNATGKESLYYVGYSRGNTVGFVLLSEIPEYNTKVKLLVALAPIAFIGHFETVVKYFIPFRKPIALAIVATTQGEFLPTNKATRIITAKFCQVQDVGLCQSVLFAIAGQDRAQLNETRVPVYSAQYPSSTSTKILLHFAQLYLSKLFRKYDYGTAMNLEIYNQTEPPDYQLSQIIAPVALFWSTNDKIADSRDVGLIRGKLTSSSNLIDYKVPGDVYNHFDFIWGIDSPKRIYEPMLDLFAQNNK